MRTEHAKLPLTSDWLGGYGWIIDADGNYIAEVVTSDEEGRCVNTEIAQQTSKFIETACNAHYDLLNAVRVALTNMTCPFCGRDNAGYEACSSEDCIGVQAVRKAEGVK